MVDMKDRYLLCRPREGLNDTLCQIERCWRYSRHFGRHLVIDCQRSSFFGDFSDFFEIIDKSLKVTLCLSPMLLRKLNSLPCIPSSLHGRLSSYKAVYKEGSGFVDNRTGEPTRFNAEIPAREDCDFDEPLLVHEDCGGGDLSFSLLKRLRFSPPIQYVIRDELEKIGSNYLAVHVRNTDLCTDYRSLFACIRRRVGRNRLLVCSDDPSVVQYAHNYFPGQIISFSGREGSFHPSGALHQVVSHADGPARRQAVINSLIDLVALGNAQKFFYTSTHSHLDSEKLLTTGECTYYTLGRPVVSGFSLLAQYLCRRKDVLDQLLGLPVKSRRNSESSAASEVDIRSRWQRLKTCYCERASALSRRFASKVARTSPGLNPRSRSS